MSLNQKYQKGDTVLVKSFAGPEVWVRLIERIDKIKDNWGAPGWNAKIIYKNDINKLRKRGVPYNKEEKPIVFVFDWHIIKKRSKRQDKREIQHR